MSRWRIAHLVFFAACAIFIVFCQVMVHASIPWIGVHVLVLGSIFTEKLNRYRRAG